MIVVGSSTVEIKIGTQTVQKIVLGTVQIWPVEIPQTNNSLPYTLPFNVT